MENINYKVGDRIRVFEITEIGANHYEKPTLKGLQRAEDETYLGEDSCGFSLVTKDKSSFGGNLHFGTDERGHAKHVATMVITKLK